MPSATRRFGTLAEAIESYFGQCGEKSLPNKAGLCVALGILRDTYKESHNSLPVAG